LPRDELVDLDPAFDELLSKTYRDPELDDPAVDVLCSTRYLFEAGG
jgi:hypothetical protein